MGFFRNLQYARRGKSFLLSPVNFQGVTALLAICLVSLGLYVSFKRAVTPTDQNWFTEPPSQIYLSKSVRAIVAERTEKAEGFTNASGDSVLSGVFIFRMGDRDIKTEADLLEALQSVPSEAPVELDVLDPVKRRKGTVWVAYSDLISDNYFVLDGVAMVIEVMEGGASDRAGMRVGDLIIQIDNRKFGHVYEAEEIMRSIGPRNTVAYDIMRGVEVQRLYVTLAKYGFPLVLLLLNILGVLVWASGVFVALKTPENKAGRLLGILFIALSFVMIAEGRVLILEQSLNTVLVHTVIFCKALSYSILLHIWFYFPKYRSDIEQHQDWFIPLSYVLPQLLHIVPFLGKQGPGIQAGYETFLLIFVVFVSLFWFVRGSDDLEYKKIGKYLVSILFFVAVVSISGIPQIKEIVIALIPVSFLYATGRFGLINLDIRIRRNIQYWFVTSAWFGLLGILFLGAFRLFAGMAMAIPDIQFTTGSIEVLDATDAGSPVVERTIFMLLGMGLFIAFIRSARIGQTLINRKYHKSSYDYRATNNRIHEIVSKNPSVDALNKEISKLLAELILVRRVGIAVKSSDSEHMFAWYHQVEPGEDIDLPFTKIDQLFTHLKESVNEVRIQNILHPMKLSFLKYGFTLVIPLWSRTRLYGLLLLGEKLSEDTIDQEDIVFLNVIAHQLSVAYENAFLYEQLATQERLKHEMKLARQIQLGSLPQKVPNVPGLDISGVSLPALEVGGDYYDYLTDKQKRFTVIVGDVSGKGTSAALYLSKVQGIIRTLNIFEFGPKELFARTNDFLHDEIEKKSFVTAIGGRFDTKNRVLHLARAGHLPLYHYCVRSQSVKEHTPRGMGMGMSSFELFNKQMIELEIPLEKDDVFIFASDGVTELKNHRNEEFGEENLFKLLPGIVHKEASEIRDEILKALRTFNHNGIPNDDQTLVIVKITA